MNFTYSNINNENLTNKRKIVKNTLIKNSNSNTYKSNMHTDGKYKSISGADYIYYKKLLLTRKNINR